MSLTNQQLKDRKTGLFGTDASMLDGTNEYSDPYYCYKTKRGEWDDYIEPAIHLELGHELEDYVARKYSARTGIRVRKDNRTVWNQKYLYNGKPFMGAHVDRKVVGEKKILECKTAYSRAKWGKDGSGNIPPNYLSQIKHYCLVLGICKVDLAVLFLPFPPTINVHSFDFSQMELDALLEKEYHMWDCIQRGIEPVVGGGINTSEKLRDEYKDSLPDIITSTPEITADVEMLVQIKQAVKALDKKKSEHANRIIKHMGKHEVLVNHDGDKIVSFKPDSRKQRKLLT